MLLKHQIIDKTHNIYVTCDTDYVLLVFYLLFSQLCDFAKLNGNIFYVYDDIETFKSEPQHVQIVSEEDIHVTEEIYKRPQFNLSSYR